jgi:hypothetical protein
MRHPHIERPRSVAWYFTQHPGRRRPNKRIRKKWARILNARAQLQREAAKARTDLDTWYAQICAERPDQLNLYPSCAMSVRYGKCKGEYLYCMVT